MEIEQRIAIGLDDTLGTDDLGFCADSCCELLGEQYGTGQHWCCARCARNERLPART